MSWQLSHHPLSQVGGGFTKTNMNYNKNSGYGAVLGQLPFTVSGKVFIVGASTTANIDMIKQIFNYDPDGTPRFFSTIDDAINACTAAAGDRIFVCPGHTETISNATTINLDVASVTIEGLGIGNNRPVITLDTAITTTIPVTAANVRIKNMIFSANFDDITAVFTTVAAKMFTLEDCYFKSTAVNKNFLNIIDTGTVTADMDGLTVINCKWIEPDLATLSLVKLDGTNADVTISNNFVQLGVNNNKSALMMIATGKIVTNLMMNANRVFRLNTDTATGGILLHTDGSTLSGIVSNNFAQHADVAAEILITASCGLGVFNNYASGVAGASGYILPAVDS